MGDKNSNANSLQIRHNDPWVSLSQFSVAGVPMPTCAGSFVLVGPDMAGKLVVVLDHRREAL